MQRVTIVGCGFAALAAARTLRRARADLEITLVSRRAEFVYAPSLIWVPSGQRSGDDLVVDLQRFFEREGLRHMAAEATGLSADGRVLETTFGPLENDGLIVATGGRFLDNLPGIEHTIGPCGGVAAAREIRDRLNALEGGTIAMGFAGNPDEPAATREGPILEFLLGADTQLRRERRRERFELHFFTPAPRPGSRFGDQAAERILAEMRTRGVMSHLGQRLTGFEPGQVRTENETFAADLIVFMPGMTGNTWFDNTALARSPGGFLHADAHCRVTGAERVYVAGDCGSLSAPDWLSKLGYPAEQQGRTAARNLLAELVGKQPRQRYRAKLVYIIDSHDRGMLVKRDARSSVALPPMRALHWLKLLLEWLSLRPYRRR